MDIRMKIEEIVSKVRNDPDFARSFQNNPAQAVRNAAGNDLPQDRIDEVVKGVQGMLSGEIKEDLVGGIKKMF